MGGQRGYAVHISQIDTCGGEIGILVGDLAGPDRRVDADDRHRLAETPRGLGRAGRILQKYAEPRQRLFDVPIRR